MLGIEHLSSTDITAILDLAETYVDLNRKEQKQGGTLTEPRMELREQQPANADLPNQKATRQLRAARLTPQRPLPSLEQHGTTQPPQPGR